MKKYNVTLRYSDIEKVIFAKDEEDAMEIAQEEADDNFFNAYEWAEADVSEME